MEGHLQVAAQHRQGPPVIGVSLKDQARGTGSGGSSRDLRVRTRSSPACSALSTARPLSGVATEVARAVERLTSVAGSCAGRLGREDGGRRWFISRRQVAVRWHVATGLPALLPPSFAAGADRLGEPVGVVRLAAAHQRAGPMANAELREASYRVRPWPGRDFARCHGHVGARMNPRQAAIPVGHRVQHRGLRRTSAMYRSARCRGLNRGGGRFGRAGRWRCLELGADHRRITGHGLRSCPRGFAAGCAWFAACYANSAPSAVSRARPRRAVSRILCKACAGC